MCEETGISEAQYWRLENLRLKHPSVRLYANCAIALGVELTDLLDDELKRWYPFDYSTAPEPPDPEWWYDHSYLARPRIGRDNPAS
jgi:transcriptional regulator with XRE-family HTH domain